MSSETGQSSLDNILITKELSNRLPKTPNLKAENDAFRTLVRQLAEHPQTLLKTLVAIAKDLCQAGTAGVSLLETLSSGETVFRWVALAGELEQYEQGTTPRHLSPCGVCLDCQSPQLYAYPGQYFAELQATEPLIVEALVIPLIAGNQPLGAIWILSHDPQRQFDAEDVRVMSSLADFTAVALHNNQARQTSESAQIELRKREAELSLVTNAVPVLISFIDSQRCYRFNNRTYEEWFGRPAAEVYGKPMWEVLGRAAYQTICPYVEQVLAGQQVTFESEVPYQDGGTRYIQATYVPRFDSQGSVEGFVALVSDISQRKQAEEQVRQQTLRSQMLAEVSQAFSEALLDYQTVLDAIAQRCADVLRDGCAIRLLSEDGQWLNPVAVYHRDPDTLAFIQEYLVKAAQKADEGLHAHVLQTNQPLIIPAVSMDELRSRVPPSALPYLERFQISSILIAPLRARSRVIGTISTSRDQPGQPYTLDDQVFLQNLADRAALGIDNARLYREAQQANRIKDEFLAVLSHELRSPLNPILGWAKLLQDRKLDEATTVTALAAIERNAKLQAELIEDLLDVSRILQGKLSLNMVPVNLISTIQAAMETVRLAAEAKSIQIQTEFDPSARKILGDAARIQQVVWNLCSNAVKFTPVGGQVDIRLKRSDSQAQIIVSDTGKGIADNFLPHVFDYFRQADSATTRKFGGLGLGLAIVHHLVELHGGTIQAESQGEGMGATFTVRLPLLRSNRNEIGWGDTSLAPSPPHPLTGLQILIVDDDADTREYLAFLLEQAGARVTSVASASEAFALLTQSKLDLLLSDIGMPDMDGYMLLRQVRTLPSEQGGNIPAIALTAYAGETNQQQALAAGFQRHVAKPVEPEELIRVITSLF